MTRNRCFQGLFTAVACLSISLAQASALATRDYAYLSVVRGYGCYQPPTVVNNGATYVTLTQFVEPYGFAVMKLDGAGVMDASWGSGGIAGIPAHREGLFPLADGKVLAIGRKLLRLTAAGAIDPTYRGADVPEFRFQSAAVQAYGSLVIAMDDERPFGVGDYRLVFVRFTPDGERDLTFGPSGILATPIDMRAETIFAWSVRVDGTVDVASYARTADGSIAPTLRRFSTGREPVTLTGNRKLPEQGLANWLPGTVKVDASGGVLIATSGLAAAIWRFRPDGSLDEGFDLEGRTAARQAAPTSWYSHYEGVLALWQAPGGGWIMPIHAIDTDGVGFFRSTVAMKEPVVLFDRFGARSGLLDRLVHDTTVVGVPTRLDDGGFLYRSDFRDCNVLKAKGAHTRVEATMVEYHHRQRDHYFITLDGAESAALDQPGSHWIRTARTFGAWATVEQPGAVRVCRFHGDSVAGPESHFYAPEGFECDGLRSIERQAAEGKAAWRMEGFGFRVAEPSGGACAGNLVPVYRVYNRGFERGAIPNHRYVADPGLYADMQARGWAAEGIRFCVPPAGTR